MIPVYAFYILTFFAVTVPMEIGYRLGRAVYDDSHDHKEASITTIAGIILSLSGLILAFSFNIVTGRFEAKRELVRNEANAIRTAYLRTDFLPEAERSEAQNLLKGYLDARIEFVQAANILDREDVRYALKQAELTHKKLWQGAVANARRDM